MFISFFRTTLGMLSNYGGLPSWVCERSPDGVRQKCRKGMLGDKRSARNSSHHGKHWKHVCVGGDDYMRKPPPLSSEIIVWFVCVMVASNLPLLVTQTLSVPFLDVCSSLRTCSLKAIQFLRPIEAHYFFLSQQKQQPVSNDHHHAVGNWAAEDTNHLRLFTHK